MRLKCSRISLHRCGVDICSFKGSQIIPGGAPWKVSVAPDWASKTKGWMPGSGGDSLLQDLPPRHLSEHSTLYVGPPRLQVWPPRLQIWPLRLLVGPPRLQVESPRLQVKLLMVLVEPPRVQVGPPRLQVEPAIVQVQLPRLYGSRVSVKCSMCHIQDSKVGLNGSRMDLHCFRLGLHGSMVTVHASRLFIVINSHTALYEKLIFNKQSWGYIPDLVLTTSKLHPTLAQKLCLIEESGKLDWKVAYSAPAHCKTVQK